jgi:hypothetical protein
LSGFPAWVWWLLPVVYIICDFAKDTLIFTMLRWPSTIQEQALDALTYLRAIKIGTVTLSMAQVLLLCFASYIPALRSGAQTRSQLMD